MTTTHAALHLRWAIRADLPDILAIEQASFPQPWTKADFLRALRTRNTIGYVAMQCDTVVGYIVCQLHQASIDVLNIAVSPAMRRRGIGRMMMAAKKKKLLPDRRHSLTAMTSETNLVGQQFLRGCGLQCTEIREPGDGHQWDCSAYCFEFDSRDE